MTDTQASQMNVVSNVRHFSSVIAAIVLMETICAGCAYYLHDIQSMALGLHRADAAIEMKDRLDGMAHYQFGWHFVFGVGAIIALVLMLSLTLLFRRSVSTTLALYIGFRTCLLLLGIVMLVDAYFRAAYLVGI